MKSLASVSCLLLIILSAGCAAWSAGTSGSVPSSDFRGDIEAGETKRLTFLVDAGARVHFIVMTLDADLETVIYDPDGTRIDPQVADTNTNIEYGKEDTGEGGKYIWYVVQNPIPGKWQVEITATTGGEYIASVEIESDVSLVASTDRGSYRIDEEIQIRAMFRDGDVPIIGADVIAEIWKPDQSVDKVTLYDDGTHSDDTPDDGIYFNVYPGSSTPGYMDISVTAATASIARTADHHIVVTPGTARLIGVYSEKPIDSDADGLYDILRVDIEVDIVTAGHYEIAGYLEKDPLQPAIAYAEYNTQLQGTGQLSPGRHYIPLNFDGERIHTSRLDGPYQVRVILYDQSDTSIEIDTNAREPYITAKYAADRFQD